MSVCRYCALSTVIECTDSGGNSIYCASLRIEGSKIFVHASSDVCSLVDGIMRYIESCKAAELIPVVVDSAAVGGWYSLFLRAGVPYPFKTDCFGRPDYVSLTDIFQSDEVAKACGVDDSYLVQLSGELLGEDGHIAADVTVVVSFLAEQTNLLNQCAKRIVRRDFSE